MTKQRDNQFLILILLVVSSILILAFIIEHVLGHEACNLCIYQRIPYVISFFLIIKILFIAKYKKITLLILSLVFLSGSILSFYHFGIEQGFFNESFMCKDKNLLETLSKKELLEHLKQNTTSCKDINFKILGISLATINTLFSLILSVIFAKLFLNYEKNK